MTRDPFPVCPRPITVLLALAWGLALAAPARAGEQDLGPVPDRPAAHAFRLPDLDGRIHRLEDYRGRPVIVNFWATWCPPCRRELPSMNRAWQTLEPAGVAMLAIDVGEDADTVFTFTADYPIEFPALLDRDGSEIEHWPVLGLPTTFVLDPEGRIVYRAVGGRDWDRPELLQKVLELRRP